MKKIIFTTDAKLKIREFAAQKSADDSAPADEKEQKSDDIIGTITGYAITFGALSSDRGGYKVRLMPGSPRFTEPCHALYHHEWTGGPLGDTKTGSLRILPADDYGIPVEIDLPDTTNGRDTLTLVKAGRMEGMSFSMVEEPTGEEVDEDGEKVFNVSDFLCDEVTCTPIPAFVTTTLASKFAADVKEDDAEAEKDTEDAKADADADTEKTEDTDIEKAKEMLRSLLAKMEAEETDDVKEDTEEVVEDEAKADEADADPDDESDADEPEEELADGDDEADDTEEDEEMADSDEEAVDEDDDDAPVEEVSRNTKHAVERVNQSLMLQRLRLDSFRLK